MVCCSLLAGSVAWSQAPAAVTHYRAGYTLLQSKDFRNAAIELEAAVGVDSTYGDAHYALGMAQAALGDYDKAADALEAALRHGLSREGLASRIPGLLGDLYYKAALRSQQQRRFGEAVIRYERSLELKPGNAKAYYQIGVCHLNLRQPERAEPALRAAIAADPAYAWPYKSLGDIHRQRGEVQQAAQMYTEAIDVDAGLVQAYAGLARTRMDAGDFEGAVEALRRAVDRDPEYGEGFVLIGSVLSQLQRYSEAIAPLKKAIDLDADDVEAHYRLAEAYYGIGDFRSAIKSAQAAVGRKKAQYPAMVVLADAHGHLGQLAEARTWYEKAAVDSRFKDYCAHKLEELERAASQAQGRRP